MLPQRETRMTTNNTLPRRFISPLLALFCVLWVVDGFLTFWAIQNGYVEIWNGWTRAIAGTWAFPVLKLVTAGLVVILVWLVKRITPNTAFIFLAASNVLIGTVLVANVVTLVGA